jgi:hypothetical protein
VSPTGLAATIEPDVAQEAVEIGERRRRFDAEMEPVVRTVLDVYREVDGRDRLGGLVVVLARPAVSGHAAFRHVSPQR